MTVNDVLPRLRELAWWLLPLGALLVVLGVEIHLGDPAGPPPIAAVAAAAPQPVAPSLLPEYTIPGGVETRAETVNRTLFNPTRRPAPTPAQETAKTQMPRGQFALTGTTVVEGKSTAFLREVSGGKFRRVNKGDTLNGMLVADVKPDRVKLTMGDESEELVLKVVPNPKPTPGAPPTMPQVANAPAALPAPGMAEPNGVQSLIARRRAARAAAAAAQSQGQPGAAAAPVAPAPGMPAGPRAMASPQQAGGSATNPPQSSATWADVFRHYQERSAGK